jgi:hypothetical protein
MTSIHTWRFPLQNFWRKKNSVHGPGTLRLLKRSRSL